MKGEIIFKLQVVVGGGTAWNIVRNNNTNVWYNESNMRV